MYKKLFITSLCAFLYLLTNAQSSQFHKANEVLKERGEVYFSFQLASSDNISELDMLTTMISLDNLDGSKVFAYANSREFAEFEKLGYNIKVLTPPSMIFESVLENSQKDRDVSSFDYYPTYEEYVSMMYQFETDYPDMCEIVNIGYSTDGRELLFAHINNDLEMDQNEPEFMYTSTIHGDEVTGYVLMLRLIDHLLVNYGTDSEITDIVDNIDIWINPNANPDGTYAGGNNTVWAATRANANSVDLNRNYADPEDGPHPDGNEYQIETIAFMDFADEHDFVMSANFHGGAEVANYPWDTWPQLAADDDWWEMVSREYADTCQFYSTSGYFTDLDNGITNGYAWYTISGGRQDYMNYFKNCRELTLEISETKLLPESQLDNFWEYNYRSLINYMKQSLYGFSGIVTNSVTGDPVHAKVNISGHDYDNSYVYSNLPVGNYYRPIKEGTYNVTFSAFGYYDQVVENVPVTDYQNYILNVELVPILAFYADFSSSTELTSPGIGVDYYDESAGGDIIDWHWTFEGGTPEESNDRNPSGIIYNEPGDYKVTLTVSVMSGNSDTKEVEDYIIIKEALNMCNDEVSTCDALFYDSGSDTADYSNHESYTMVIWPGTVPAKVVLEFLEFDIEYQADCENDYLEIYNGADVSAPLIGRYCGSDNPGTITADNEYGALTLYFSSNYTIVKPGWKAMVSCDSGVSIIENTEEVVNVFPVPANDHLYIEAHDVISSITISDLHGSLIINEQIGCQNADISTSNLKPGMYLLTIQMNNRQINKKILVGY